MGRKFQRKKEDFRCEHCGTVVEGDGYTNHCPECLSSSHVDVMPGDRASLCGGLMKPVFVEQKKESYRLTHQCVKCGYSKKNKVSANDNFDTLLRVAQRIESALEKEPL